MKFMVWNIEWMNRLFVSGSGPASFKDPDAETHHRGPEVQTRVRQITDVINALAPDIVVVVEAPNRQTELDHFFGSRRNSGFGQLNGSWRTHLQATHGSSQAIGIAWRTDTALLDDDSIADLRSKNDACTRQFLIDVDGDGVREAYRFARQPLYVEVTPSKGKGNPFHILGVHLKSKGVFTALEWGARWRRAEGNRRRIVAEALRLRRALIEPHLQAGKVPLLVCGDINDGPGMDVGESKLRNSGIECLMGSVWRPRLVLRNAGFDQLGDKKKENEDFGQLATTRFADPIVNDVYHKVWIDHLLYSQTDGNSEPWVTNARICNSLERGKKKPKIWQTHRFASDHYPITATLAP